MGVEYLAFSVPKDIYSKIDVAALPSDEVESLVNTYRFDQGEIFDHDTIELGKLFRFLFFLMTGEEVFNRRPDQPDRPIAHAFFGGHPIVYELSYITPTEVEASSRALREHLENKPRLDQHYRAAAERSERDGRPFREGHKVRIMTILGDFVNFFDRAAERGRAVVVEIG